MSIDTNSPHIVFFTHSWEPEQGPPQWRMRRFVDACRERGFQCSVITATARGGPHGSHTRLNFLQALKKLTPLDDSSEESLHVYRTSSFPASPSLLSRIIEQGFSGLSATVTGCCLRFAGPKPSLVVATVPALPSAFPAFVTASLYDVPLVIDLRDAWPDLVESVDSWESAPIGKSIRARLSLSLVRLIGRLGGWGFGKLLRRADHIVTTSRLLAESLRDRKFASVSTVLNTPVTSLPFPAVNGFGSLHEFRPGDRPLRILYAGTIGRAQGLSNAVRAAAACVDAGHEIEFKIVGKGAELGIVKSLAMELGAPIEFLDPRDLEEMDSLYEWCDTALVHLQDWPPLRMTIPSKLLEIMGRGIPVTLSADGESADIVRQTSAGAIANAMDSKALSAIWSDWSTNGIPKLKHETVRSWLDGNADPTKTSRDFVETIELILGQSGRS